MISEFAVAVALSALAVAVWSFVLVARNRPPQRALLAGLAAVEVLLIAQAVLAAVLLIAGERPGSMPTFIGYLAGSLVVLPLGTVWALAERSRSATAVLGVACVTVSVLVLRLYEVWGGAGA
ncbi:hypothetical protein B0I33_11171 [Prauserella shujinwangii]|uniref:Integral membrane protein n=1 Tax=Prauserella shujinwangii TaxID=1453103 RepID=A0A2T0LMZ2_9PSEU|nr:hypothetical protein [Prauserella shujinwangii]PRX44562.1 hypothetical protein B0I33_11171 [Prauserella shujinwangii]